MFSWFYVYSTFPSGTQRVSCAFWHVSDWNVAHGFMFILHPALALIGGELYILACW